MIGKMRRSPRNVEAKQVCNVAFLAAPDKGVELGMMQVVRRGPDRTEDFRGRVR
jgi:hypothetical protein